MLAEIQEMNSRVDIARAVTNQNWLGVRCETAYMLGALGWHDYLFLWLSVNGESYTIIKLLSNPVFHFSSTPIS